MPIKINVFPFILFSFFITSLVIAEPINLVGVWSGKVSTRHLQCEGTRVNRLKSNFSMIMIDNQRTNNTRSRFNITLTNNNLKSTGVGELKPDNGIRIANISGSDDRRREQFSVLGRVKKNKMTLEFIGFDVKDGERCLVRGSGTFFRAGAFIDDRPDLSEEQLSKITQSGRLMRHVGKTRAVTGRRIQNRRRAQRSKNKHHQPQVHDLSDGFMVDLNTVAAGDGLSSMGVWSSYSRNRFENTFALTQYKGNTNSYFFGVDFALNDSFLLGISIGYDDTDITSKINNGQESIAGFNLSPYMAYAFNDMLSVDLIAGMSRTESDESRVNLSQETLKATVKGKNWFVAGNLNGFWDFEPLMLNTFMGFLYAASEDSTTLETNGRTITGDGTRLVQYNIGGELSYQIADFEPYLNAVYNDDSYATKTAIFGDEQPKNDDDDFLLTLGVRYYHQNGLSLIAAYSQRLNREDFKEKTFNLNARWDF